MFLVRAVQSAEHRKTRVGLGDFTPGVERAKAAGYAIEVARYPDGVAGVTLSLDVIAQKIRNGRLDPDIRGWAGDVLLAAGKPTRRRDQVQALLDAFRAATMYVPDPVGAEYIASGVATACLRPGLCVRARDCFPAGTKVLRQDFALLPIEEIRVGDRIWGRDQWTTVQAKWAKGELPVDAIEMNNGSTMCLTADHKVYVGRCKHGNGADCWCSNCAPPSARHESYERIHVSELLEGDVLLRPERIAFGSEETDPDRLYVEGLALADGWTEGRSFRIGARDGKRKEKHKHEVKAICDRLGIETKWHRRYITVKDPEWALRLSSLGARARFKHADSLNLTEAGAKALMAGLMADSTANSNGPGRTFSTTSYTMMVQMRVLQRMFGVTTGVKMLTPEEHGGAGEHPLWRVYVWAGTARAEKTLAVRAIDRSVRTTQCWDITTEDHYVYLPEHDVTVSNCDDGVVFMGSAIMSIGIPVVVVKQNFGAGKQEHVLVEAQAEDGTWFPADPSTSLDAGQKVPAVSEQRINPMDTVGSAGTSGAEIVTLGGVPQETDARDVHFDEKRGAYVERRYGKTWVYQGTGMGWAELEGVGDACCAACAAGAPKCPCEGAAGAGTASPDDLDAPCGSCEAFARRLRMAGMAGIPTSAVARTVARAFNPFGLIQPRAGLGAAAVTTGVGVGTVIATLGGMAVAAGVGWGLAKRRAA